MPLYLYLGCSVHIRTPNATRWRHGYHLVKWMSYILDEVKGCLHDRESSLTVSTVTKKKLSGKTHRLYPECGGSVSFRGWYQGDLGWRHRILLHFRLKSCPQDLLPWPLMLGVWLMFDLECINQALNKRFNNTLLYHVVQFIIKDNINLIFLNSEIHYKVDVLKDLQ